jgi:hypothetical protein
MLKNWIDYNDIELEFFSHVPLIFHYIRYFIFRRLNLILIVHVKAVFGRFFKFTFYNINLVKLKLLFFDYY